MIWNCYYYYRYKIPIISCTCIDISQILVINFNTTLNLTYSNKVVKMNEMLMKHIHQSVISTNSIITSETGDCDITAFMSVYPYTLTSELTL